MDIEKLIKRLKCPQIQSCPMDGEYPSCKACQKSIQQEVTTALSTLQAENEKLRAELNDLTAQWDMYGGDEGITATFAELEQVKKKNKYSAHDVALILSDAFGDSCACNFNGGKCHEMNGECKHQTKEVENKNEIQNTTGPKG